MNKQVVNSMFALIRKVICGAVVSEEIKQTLSPEQLPQLYTLSKSHDMAHIVSQALSDLGLLGEDEISAKFKKQQMLSVYRCTQIQYELDQICTVFESEKIPHIPLKGAVIRQYYPQPDMRTSCDIDMFVPVKHLDAAIEALVSKLYYRKDKKYIYDFALYSPTNVHIELHFNLVEDAKQYKKVLSNVWKNAYQDTGYQYRYLMSNEMYLVYHMIHMKKHLLNGGCGVRPFVDIWVLNHNCSFNKQKRYDLLEAAGLLQFAKAVEELSEVWINNEPPTARSEQLERLVLSGGTYGTAENRIAVQQVVTGGKFRYIMSRIFLPYDLLKLSYPNLEKRKWLLPFYQVKRWFRLFEKRTLKRSMQEAKATVSVTNEENDQTTQLLKELGIK